ncbi:MAG: hypothetical protein RR473_06945 [Comamonas sp.]
MSRLQQLQTRKANNGLGWNEIVLTKTTIPPLAWTICYLLIKAYCLIIEHSLSFCPPLQRLSDSHATLTPHVAELPLKQSGCLTFLGELLQAPADLASLDLLFLSFYFLMVCPSLVPAVVDTMNTTQITERVGNYVVTPLTQITHSGKVAAAVSIRRGKYDRIFSFIEQFDSQSIANKYALTEGRSMVLCNQLN